MKYKLTLTTTWLIISLFSLQAQEIPVSEIIPTEKLSDYLKPAVKEKLSKEATISQASLAKYFRETFQERFFYDWRTVDERFEQYNQLYGNQSSHQDRAKDHLTKYPDSTHWLLPFNYQNGEPVNAYALRHLARQHKMVDIAYLYHYDEKNAKYISYFTRQMQSLNHALVAGKYEKIADGNGVYEAFRSGYRVLNWLSIHNLFLGETAYTDQDQLYTIATLLQHGAHLYEKNSTFRYGNHQTRGMSALAMLSILLRDFEGTELWYERSMSILGEHLDKEINEDGFQFERSVHYHLSDISNYFYVYQLAQISDISVSPVWEKRLRSLFETLTQIAYPDKTTPVLQDDTDDPWAEKNQISRTMSLGYLLFQEPEFGFFADKKVAGKLYWFLNKDQLAMLSAIKTKKPESRSLHFPQTGYYIMREGWNKGDRMMIISAGLDKDKPDHQHGDMLGIQAMVNGHVILPNYQVRYSLKDYDFFKNSMVKNVALVDDELQGKEWRGNKGGSGFGKFGNLPQPKVIAWENNDEFDLFVGSHDGFENKDVAYSRQIIYVKDGFWVVKDNFRAEEAHTYKQVWQGHYTSENGAGLLRSSFADGSGCYIFQLNSPDRVMKSGKRGKEWSVVAKEAEKDFSFISLIYPFSEYGKRINEEDKKPILSNWKLNQFPYEIGAAQSLSKDKSAFLFGVKEVELENLSLSFSIKTDVYFSWNNGEGVIQILGDEELDIDFIKNSKQKKDLQKMKLLPGELLRF